MILRPEYRALAEAAAAAGLVIEAGVLLKDRLALALVVAVPPFRFAPIVAAYPPGQWLLRGADESLTDYARRAWAVLDPLQRAVLRAGFVPAMVSLHEARDRPAEVVERLQATRDALVCIGQGMSSADAMKELDAFAEYARRDP